MSIDICINDNTKIIHLSNLFLSQLTKELNHLGICHGVTKTRTLVDDVRKSHDGQILVVKKNIEVFTLMLLLYVIQDYS